MVPGASRRGTEQNEGHRSQCKEQIALQGVNSAWKGMVVGRFQNADGTSMEHPWHHRWNIYGLGLENWMKTGDDFHGVGIGLMPWDASNHPMFENWILGHQIIPNLELES